MILSGGLVETESDLKFWSWTFFALGFFIGMTAGAICVGVLTTVLA